MGNKINKLRFYAQKILPLTYDNSLSYLEWLEKVVETCNEIVEIVNEFVDVVENLEVDVAEIQTQVSGILTNITVIQSHINDIDSAIGSLSDRVGYVEQDVSSIQMDVSSIRDIVASLVDQIDSLSATVREHGSAIATLETNVSELSDNISEMELDIANIESSLSSISTRLTTVESNISTLNTTVNAHTSQIEILHNTDTVFSNLFSKNAMYDNDVINRYSKNLIDVISYAENEIETDPSWESRNVNGITVQYMGNGVFKVWGTATAQTIVPLFATIDVNEIGGFKFNGLPSSADARCFLSVRQFGVSDYNTYYGDANTPSALGEIPSTSSGSLYLALQVGSYVNLGDGTTTYTEIKPMVINPNFPSGEGTNEYKEFAPYVHSLIDIDRVAQTALSGVQGLQGDVSDLETDVTALQNEPKLPTVTSADNRKVLKVIGGSWDIGQNECLLINGAVTGSLISPNSSGYTVTIEGDTLANAYSLASNAFFSGYDVAVKIRTTATPANINYILLKPSYMYGYNTCHFTNVAYYSGMWLAYDFIIQSSSTLLIIRQLNEVS